MADELIDELKDFLIEAACGVLPILAEKSVVKLKEFLSGVVKRKIELLGDAEVEPTKETKMKDKLKHYCLKFLKMADMVLNKDSVELALEVEDHVSKKLEKYAQKICVHSPK